MSMQGNIGAADTAGEILAIIVKKIEDNKDKPEIVSVLEEIKKEVEEIRNSATIGWW